jgi:hypothetical protein
MPAGSGLTLTFALKQFFPTFHLRIIAIPNLEPRAALPIRDVRPEAVLGYNPFQIHFADTLTMQSRVAQDGRHTAAGMTLEAGPTASEARAFDL